MTIHAQLAAFPRKRTRIGLMLLVLGLFVVAGPGQAQSPTLDIQGGGIGQNLDFTLEGPANEQYLMILSLSTGPTCLPNICLDVGLDLISVSTSLPGFFDFYPPSGVVSLNFPLPNDPILSALPPINFQTILIDPVLGVVDKSNLYRVTFDDPGTFKRTIEDLNVARAGAQSILLDDDRVLVIGGGDGSLTGGTGLSSCEIYARNLEAFTATDSMNTPRFLHTAVKLQDGRVLSIGGINAFGNAVSSAEIFDPSTDTWSNASSMSRARAGHQASVLGDGRVIVTGGASDFTDALSVITSSTSSTEIYDPVANAWSSGPNLSEPKLGHSHGVLATGSVLVSGGYTFTTLFGIPIPDVSDDAQVYLPNAGNGSFGPERGMRDDRLGHTSTLLSDGRVLLTGGAGNDPLDPSANSSAEIFDPSNESFTSVGSMGTPRAGGAAVLLADGTVLVSGGGNGTLLSPIALSSCEIFDPSALNFAATGDMETSRILQTILNLADGTQLVIGGAGGASSVSLNTAEVYQPE